MSENSITRLQTIIEAMPLGCCITDSELNVIDCNNATVTLFGLKNKQEYKDQFFNLSPEYQPCGELSKVKFVRYVEQAFTEGSAKFEWMHQTLDGEPIPVEVNLIHAYIDGKSVKIGYLRDLREHNKYLQAEREANERIKLMINTIPLVVTYWAEDHTLIECNQFALDFYGVNSIEEGYEKVRKSVLEGTEWFDKLDETFKTGAISFIYEDGQSNIWEMEGVRTTYNGENVVVNYGKNITQLKELQDEQRKREIAEESNRAKTMFIANMSHEIRTPVNSILGYSELAMDSGDLDITREYLNRIISSSKWLADIINNVLDISKIESGLLEFEKLPFEIGSLAERCQYLVLPGAASKNIKVCFNIESTKLSKKRRLIGDPTKIGQICTNILSNAIKFTDSGGAVTASFTVEQLDKGNYKLSFESKDTGIGMAEEQLSRIFDPFTQADSSTTRKYGGTGLGLAIAKRLVEAMGGELLVQSAIGIGSKFSFSVILPSIVVETDIIDEPVNKKKHLHKPTFKKGEVLVVDDNEMNLGVACEHLRRVGLTPTVAANGEAAIAKIQHRIDNGKAPYDLILMDIHMPIMDGKEAASAITNLNVGTPIVAMTAETFLLSADAPYTEFGINGYLNKPFTSQELWQCLLEYLKPIDPDDDYKRSAVEGNEIIDNETNESEASEIDEKMLIELKALFVESNLNTAANITYSIEQGNMKEAHRLVHSLKSSAMLIGKTQLSNTAKEIESLLNNGAKPPYKLLDKLTDELHLVLDELMQSE